MFKQELNIELFNSLHFTWAFLFCYAVYYYTWVCFGGFCSAGFSCRGEHTPGVWPTFRDRRKTKEPNSPEIKPSSAAARLKRLEGQLDPPPPPCHTDTGSFDEGQLRHDLQL